MAGTVRQAKIESRTSRARLKRGRQPHWRTIVPGRAHIGYQRKPEAQSGRWILRKYNGSAYAVEPLGTADDVLEADGERILNYEQAHQKAIAKADAAEGKPRGRFTVRRALAKYIEYLEARGQSTDYVEQRAASYILPKLGDLEVSDLKSEKIRNWLAAMAKAPALVRTKPGAPQNHKAPPGDDPEAVRRRRSSANRVLTILKAALNHAYDEKHVTSNDAWGRRVKPFRDVDVARIRYLTVSEAKRLLNASDPQFRLLVQAALETGCRYGELVRLEVVDFDPDVGTINIRRSKSGKSRHVVLTGEGAAFFGEVCAGRPGDEIMFARADGKPWRASHQGRPMRDANTNAKLMPPISFHGLRHTWASLSVMAGVPLMVVAKNLGHSDTRMVEKHYGHLAPSYIADAIRERAPKFGFKAEKKLTRLSAASRTSAN
jgi:integrase